MHPAGLSLFIFIGLASSAQDARDNNCTDLFYTFLWTARRQPSWHDVFVAMPLCPVGEEKFNLLQKDWLMVRLHYQLFGAGN